MLKVSQVNQACELTCGKNFDRMIVIEYVMLLLFWAIKRQDKADDKYNLHLALVDQVFVATLDEIKNEEVKAAFAKAQIQTQATTFTIRLPVLMNDADIQAGTELILKHHVQPKEKKQPLPKSWVDEHSAEEKRRRLNLR